jgi:hypothetical protein
LRRIKGRALRPEFQQFARKSATSASAAALATRASSNAAAVSTRADAARIAASAAARIASRTRCPGRAYLAT